ncbi:hypothetical protein H0H81_005690 [Sphagnurus paluster]|uniref:Fungal-type protein kinase domain-containing protein n=1 Tax=Sphagnurus paluster TaxID=117069 RepID=A0A9P7K8W2_9AGAR|nr:hypothetical protein H0H81_005690 [Sphagnurus paluster]
MASSPFVKKRRNIKAIRPGLKFPRNISFLSQPRYASDISTPRVISKADTAEQAARDAALSNQKYGTPVKSSNVRHARKQTKQGVLDGLTRELLNRRWISADLVEHAFGDIITIQVTARIMLYFLHCGVLTVKKEGKDVDWPEACTDAASAAVFTSRSSQAGSAELKKYTWQWEAKELATGTECGAENFFNAIGMASFLAIGAIGSADLLNNSTPVTRSTLPRSHHALPCASPDAQDCRPDILALPRIAFVSKQAREATRIDEYLEKPSVLAFLGARFPNLLKPYFPEGYKDSQTDGLVFAVPADTEPGGPTEDYDELLPIPEGSLGVDITHADSAKSYNELLGHLRILHGRLEREDWSTPPEWLTRAAEAYDVARFLDMSYVCFPNVRVPGEGKQTDMRAAIVQTCIYMRQQRRTQPWLRFGLGLMSTRNQLGLLRADATGIEEYVFTKSTGHGVVESIRLALGVMLATDYELGDHPCFSFRERVIFNSDPALTGEKRSAASDEKPSNKKAWMSTSTSPSPTSNQDPPKPTRYHLKEVNLITLANSEHQPPFKPNNSPGPGQTRYYVDYLVEDRGSLVGRCTRIWCVYKEVTGGEKEDPIIRDHKFPPETHLLTGPYALKFYCADIHSEAYAENILEKAVEADVKHVLLPSDVWYLGQILNVVRDMNDGVLPDRLKSSDLKNREEVVTISAFKRTLAQYKSTEEFYGAIIGVLKAIESLEGAGFIHRDISMGNIILNDEDYEDNEKVLPSEISIDGGAPTKAIFLRRDFVDLGSPGGLHDLDMAATIPKALPPTEHIPSASELLEDMMLDPAFKYTWTTNAV